PCVGYVGARDDAGTRAVRLCERRQQYVSLRRSMEGAEILYRDLGATDVAEARIDLVGDDGTRTGAGTLLEQPGAALVGEKRDHRRQQRVVPRLAHPPSALPGERERAGVAVDGVLT